VVPEEGDDQAEPFVEVRTVPYAPTATKVVPLKANPTSSLVVFEVRAVQVSREATTGGTPATKRIDSRIIQAISRRAQRVMDVLLERLIIGNG